MAKPKKSASPTKNAAKNEKTEKKHAKLTKIEANAAEGAPVANQDEIEEQEDAAEEAAARKGGGEEAALAAVNGSPEASASFKNFRHHPDMENFYRFIYENDLRHEALSIIDTIMIEKQQRRAMKGKSAH